MATRPKRFIADPNGPKRRRSFKTLLFIASKSLFPKDFQSLFGSLTLTSCVLVRRR